jgi:hypothetical protein
LADIGALVERLVEHGLSISEASSIIAEAVAAGAATTAYRRSPGALRTEKWRENKRHKASQCDTQSAMSESVTKRHKTSQNVTSDNTPLSSSKIDLRKRGARLSPDWSPSEADRAFAKQLGWTDAQIDSEAANFRDYWIAKPGSGGCRKWVRSSKVKPAGVSATPSSTPPANIDWRSVVTMYKRSGVWSRWAGPDPDSPACKAPPELLREFGLLKTA